MSLLPRKGTAPSGDPVFKAGSPSAGLADFLSRLKNRVKPRLYDLGPAPGGNIVFFAGQGLRVYVDAERDHRTAGSPPDLGHLAEGDFEAAVLWDVIDFIPKDPAAVFASQLARVIRPGGLVFLLSSTARTDEPVPIQVYYIRSGGIIEARPVEGATARRIRRENRDLEMLFRDFTTISVHLLRSGMRELVIRRR